MSKPLTSFLVAALVTHAGVVIAGEPSSLSKTDLFTSMVRDCTAVPLATWRHPTRLVLTTYKIPLSGLELCNGGVYPIFHIGFPFEVRTSVNDRFYHRLYHDLLKANGYHRFSLLDETEKVIVHVEGGPKSVIENLETFE